MTNRTNYRHFAPMIGFIVVLIAPNFVEARTHWYSCTVKASSHTGRYTFRIATNPCQVYWREIDSHLRIRNCQLPEIAALKPSATDDLSIVWFNIETGAFYDYLAGVLDRGTCEKLDSTPLD